MKISVIVPVYNVEKYLDKCVTSILSQNYENFELILVNDGSTDKSLDICKHYRNQDERIRVIDKKNGGSTSARKAGCKLADGDYIVCIDSDDYIEQGYFSEIASIAKKFTPDFIVFPIYYITDNGDKTFHGNVLTEKFYQKEDASIVKEKFLYDPDIPGINSGLMEYSLCRKAIKRELFTRCQLQIDDKLIIGEDMICSGRVLFESECFYSASKAFYNYRLRNDSIMHNINPTIFERYDDTIIELESVERVKSYAITVFAFQSIFIQIQNMIKNMKYDDAVKVIDDSIKNEKLWKYAMKIDYKRLGMKDRVKVYIFKNRKWKLLKMLSQ